MVPKERKGGVFRRLGEGETTHEKEAKKEANLIGKTFQYV